MKQVVNSSKYLFLFQDFHEECGTQAFQKFDKDGSGFISALDFQDIMVNIKNHLLTKQVQDNLVAVSKLYLTQEKL